MPSNRSLAYSPSEPPDSPPSHVSLSEVTVPADPFELFRAWFAAAREAMVEPEAMTLASADAEGRPSARMVLLRGADVRGFTFYTNYESRKGRELEANPRAALVLYWAPLHRQVRIEGRVARVSSAESDAYFASRAVGSRISAAASPQSSVISNRAQLEHRVRELAAEHAEHVLPRPSHWGGYRVQPDAIEFWQAGEHRLHDRIRYRSLTDGGWAIERLAP
jgi:pyridoxamine 5'-phosphate oxidase